MPAAAPTSTKKLTALLLPYLKPTDHISPRRRLRPGIPVPGPVAPCGPCHGGGARRCRPVRPAAGAGRPGHCQCDPTVRRCVGLYAAGALRRHGVLLFRQHGGRYWPPPSANAVARCWPWCDDVCHRFPGHPVRRAAIASMPPAVCWTPTVSLYRRSVRRWTFPSPSAPWRMPGHS